MPEKILIFPFGGNARESLISISAINNLEKKWKVIGFIDDNKKTWGKICCGIRVIGGKDKLRKFPGAKLIAVPGNPENFLKRKDIIDSLCVERHRFANIIHPSATVAMDVEIGFNTLIMPNVVIGCGTKIGNHCVILPNTVIAHDTVIGDYCCIGSNVAISGGVALGQGCYTASGSSLRDGISIGVNSMIGIGSNVVSNIGRGVIAAGNPARVIRRAGI